MNIFKTKTNLLTILVSMIVGVFGVGLLIFSEFADCISKLVWLKAVVANFGGLLVATVALALLWELFSKRSFFDEMLAKTGLVDELRMLGLIGISTDPQRGPDFHKLITETCELDIFVAYANTWRSSNQKDLDVLARKTKAKVRLIVPNPNNAALMAALASQIGQANKAALSKKISDSVAAYTAIFKGHNAAKSATFQVFFHDDIPVTSFFRFDSTVVVNLYKHARGLGDVPVLIGNQGGALYRYVEKELEAMTVGADGKLALAKLQP